MLLRRLCGTTISCEFTKNIVIFYHQDLNLSMFTETVTMVDSYQKAISCLFWWHGHLFRCPQISKVKNEKAKKYMPVWNHIKTPQLKFKKCKHTEKTNWDFWSTKTICKITCNFTFFTFYLFYFTPAARIFFTVHERVKIILFFTCSETCSTLSWHFIIWNALLRNNISVRDVRQIDRKKLNLNLVLFGHLIDPHHKLNKSEESQTLNLS